MNLFTVKNFDSTRWQRIQTDSTAWWQGSLERPLLQIRLHNAPSTRKPAKVPYHHFQSFYDLSIPAADIIDAWDYELSKTRFVGDAFPHIFVNFGPGVIAAFLGCTLKNGNGTVWFHSDCRQDICDVRLKYNKDNPWLIRVKEIMNAAIERWQGTVQIGMTDLGGNLDILSTFRPDEGLLLDLYDHPEAVKSLTFQAHELWWRYFDELNTVLRTANPGYTAWCPIFSASPYYMLQCDFSYMIGPDMFDEFVKPELMASCKKLANPFYHLDGRGQLPHLESLLAIPQLKGIQWVPGEGSPGQKFWPDVYRKIYDAGKLIQIYDSDDLTVFDAIVEQTGTAQGIVLIADVDVSQADRVEALIEKWYK
jgi:hypothetical protein